MERMRSLAEIMPELIERLPLEPVVVLRSLWPALVGKMLAERTEPLGLGSGILRIAVCDRTWKTQIQALEHEIVGKINGLAGKQLVRELRLVLKRNASAEDPVEREQA